MKTENYNKFWTEVRYPVDISKSQVLDLENKIKILLADNLPFNELNNDLDEMVSTWNKENGDRVL